MPVKKLLIPLTLVVLGGPLGWWGGSVLKNWLMIHGAPRKMQVYLDSHPVRKLQIGAGTVNYPGWLNTDFEPANDQVYLDATKPFPLPEASIQYIFGEHLIEHLTYEEGLNMLRECRRVLAPGGKIRLATPDLLRLLQLFQDGKTEAMEHYIVRKLKWHGWPMAGQTAAQILNGEMHSFGHQFVYDPATLSDSLLRAGFVRIAQFAPGESDDPELRGIEWRHEDSRMRELNDYETMVFQAARP